MSDPICSHVVVDSSENLTSPFEDRESTVFLELANAIVFHVQGKQWTPIDEGPFYVLCLQSTSEESEALRALGLDMFTRRASTSNSSSENVNGLAGVTEMYFVTCGEYKIPLHKCIPVIKTEPRSYVFVLPEGLFLGVQFPEAVSDDEIDVFEVLVMSYTTIRQKSTVGSGRSSTPPSSTLLATTSTTTASLNQMTTVTANSALTTVSSSGSAVPSSKKKFGVKVEQASQVAAIGITTGGALLASKIDRGAEKLRKALVQGGNMVVNKLEPSSHPTRVSAATMDKLHQAKRATATVCAVSGSIANGMVNATKAVASAVAEKITSRVESPQGHHPVANAAYNVAAATLYAAGTVLNSASDAGRSMLETTGGEVTKVVGHKFGDQAASVACLGSSMVTDVYDSAGNLRYFKSAKRLLKNTAKNLAKETGKAVAGNLTLSDGEEEEVESQRIIDSENRNSGVPAIASVPTSSSTSTSSTTSTFSSSAHIAPNLAT